MKSIAVIYTGCTVVTIEDDNYERLVHTPAESIWRLIEDEIRANKVDPLTIKPMKWSDV